jgi:ABC-type sugar transport system ATPase subunit
MREVEFKAVNKTYPNGYVAVERLDLRVEEGEFLVLLGPSGCGKSTTLRMLAGLETVSNGDILIGGTKVNDLPPGARELGMVFQSYALYPHMTIEDNLSFGLRMAKQGERLDSREIANRVGEAADMLDLTQLLDRKPKALSGGQRQRVAIGRSLVRRPKVLLMDEPLSNLDAKLRNQMRIELRRLHELHGTTTVYVTHDQVEAMTLADRIAIMHGGILQQHAPPLEAYHNPNNPFVASFLGTPAMNLIQGKVENQKFKAGDLCFELPDHLKDTQCGNYTFGIRPENVNVVSQGGLRCDVRGVERLGDQTIYHLNAAGQEVTALRHQQIDEGFTSTTVDTSYVHISLTEPATVLFPQ